MRRIFLNKNREIRSGFKIALFFFIYLITTATLGQILIGITYGIIGRNNSIGGQNFNIRVERYLFNTEVGVFLLQLVGFMAMLIAAIIVLRIMENKRFRDIGFSSIKGKELLLGLILGASSMAFIFIILLFTGNITLKNSLMSPNLSTNALWGIALYLVVALNEEIMCRGYVQTTLNQMKMPWVSAIMTSAMFSALHLGNPNVKTIGLFNIFLVGLLFSYMYIKTKSLWMPIGYHFTWNYFQGNVFGFPVSGTTQSKGLYNIAAVKENILTGGSFGPEAGILTTLVIVIGVAVVWRMTKHKNYNT